VIRLAIEPPSIAAHLRFGLAQRSRWIMRGILLWFLGIPIPIIILLYLFHAF